MTCPGGYTGWTFAGNSGVTRDGSAFQPPPTFPDGSQAAFLQRGGLASVTQNVNGFLSTEAYIIKFSVGSRFNKVPTLDETGFIDVVSVTGTAAAIPEPSTILMAGAGFLAVALLRRRR